MLIRKALPIDRDEIADLYRAASASVQGISRRPHEITETYIYSLLNDIDKKMVFLVATEEVDGEETILGCVHATKSDLEVYSHILSDLTVMVSPSHQKNGIGKFLGIEFLKHVAQKRPDIKRVEMEALSAQMHLDTYKAAGFIKEGEIKERVKNVDGTFSDSVLLVWINPSFKA